MSKLTLKNESVPQGNSALKSKLTPKNQLLFEGTVAPQSSGKLTLNRKYTTIIFDLDGTLLDTLVDLNKSVNYALEKNGFPVKTLEETRRFLGNGMGRLVMSSLPEGTSEEIFNIVLGDFKKYYEIHSNDNTKLYEGIDKLLDILKKLNYNLAIVSNKVQSAVSTLRTRYFDTTISVAFGEQVGIKRKPAPDMVFMAMKEFNASPDETLYVGDSEVDIQTAINAGIDCVSVDWGFRSADELMEAGATIIIEEPLALLERFLLREEGGEKKNEILH
ncbi:MAG: HAD family hydrolase [Clostridiales bacterium]|nr:HAD family hydrolase [Clostridiales bacterium]